MFKNYHHLDNVLFLCIMQLIDCFLKQLPFTLISSHMFAEAVSQLPWGLNLQLETMTYMVSWFYRWPVITCLALRGSFYLKISGYVYVPIPDRTVFLYNTSWVFTVMLLRLFVIHYACSIWSNYIFIQKVYEKLIFRVVSGCVKI